jgi:3-hydroxyisobutyrate dehydrogenase-like beta-hydroxyacid dehydrogenase
MIQEIIITIVPEGRHVLAVYSDAANGALCGSVKGKVFIDSSTIDIETSTTVSERVHSQGGYFIDAPVSGGTTGAKAGTITFMVGAEKESDIFNSVRASLETMGKNIMPCGGPTLGLAAKLCNNYISGTIAIATSEGMNIAIKLGLDPKVFSSVVATSTGGSWVNCK